MKKEFGQYQPTVLELPQKNGHGQEARASTAIPVEKQPDTRTGGKPANGIAYLAELIQRDEEESRMQPEDDAVVVFTSIRKGKEGGYMSQYAVGSLAYGPTSGWMDHTNGEGKPISHPTLGQAHSFCNQQ
jgi:hypothetical protein